MALHALKKEALNKLCFHISKRTLKEHILCFPCVLILPIINNLEVLQIIISIYSKDNCKLPFFQQFYSYCVQVAWWKRNSNWVITINETKSSPVFNSKRTKRKALAHWLMYQRDLFPHQPLVAHKTSPSPDTSQQKVTPPQTRLLPRNHYVHFTLKNISKNYDAF